MSKRYICYSGWVKSKYDGDMHPISCYRVAELYKVNPSECIFIDTPADLEHKTKGFTPEALEAMTPLWPENRGDYKL